MSRCEKITRYSRGGDVSLVFHVVTVPKMTEVVAVCKLPLCCQAWPGWLKQMQQQWAGEVQAVSGVAGRKQCLQHNTRRRSNLEWDQRNWGPWYWAFLATPVIAKCCIQEIEHLLFPMRTGPILLENSSVEQPCVLNSWHCLQFHHVQCLLRKI